MHWANVLGNRKKDNILLGMGSWANPEYPRNQGENLFYVLPLDGGKKPYFWLEIIRNWLSLRMEGVVSLAKFVGNSSQYSQMQPLTQKKD